MMEQEVLTLILSGIFLIVGILFALSSLNFKSVIVLVAMALSGLFMVLTVRNVSYNRGQMDALKGKQKYTMVIHYECVDSLYFPADTTYVLTPHFELPVAN